MSLKKICLFPPLSPQYGVVDVFTAQLAAALEKLGIEAPIVHIDKENPKEFLMQLVINPPDCTLSFNGLLPDQSGNFLCDLIRIPHVAYLIDAPTHFFTLTKSPLNIITCVDKSFAQAFTDANFPHVIFLPHAANTDIQVSPQQKRPYDVLILNSFIDYQAIRQGWEKRYSSEFCHVLDEAVELTLKDPQKTSLQAFIGTFDKHLRQGEALNPTQIDYELILDELDAYIGGKSRTELFRAIKGGKVDVFGSNAEGWREALKSNPDIQVHEPVNFEQAIELMKKAKIIVHCKPEMKQGLHERILNGLACGALVLAPESPFISSIFQHGKEILLYPHSDAQQVNSLISHYLKHEDERHQIATQGQAKVLAQHTWDQRAATLIQELPPILERIKERIKASQE